MIKTSKEYGCYKIICNLPARSKEILGGKGSTADRSYMIEQMKKHFDYFETHKIERFQNFIKPLQDYGCKTEDQRKLMNEFINYMKKTKNVDIVLLKNREMKKANSGERNILINRLVVEYPNDFIPFLKEYLQENYPTKLYSEKLVNDFQEKINQLTHPSLNIFSSCNSSEKIDESVQSEEFACESPDSNDSYFDMLSLMENTWT